MTMIAQPGARPGDVSVVAPRDVKGMDRSAGKSLGSSAFLVVSREGKATLGYTISNVSQVAGISDPNQIRLTMNGTDIRGLLSRANTSRQDGYLAPGTMETGIIDLTGLLPGELVLEWRLNMAGIQDEQVMRYAWTLVPQVLNLPVTGGAK